MPATVSKSEIKKEQDPAVNKQWDEDTPKSKQIQEFYDTVDGLNIGLLTTLRPNVGPVARSMAVAQRKGPDFYFLANIHSDKFSDLEHSKNASITFQDSKTQNWVSISGQATKASSEDHKVHELYTPMMTAWFGDLGDGVHTGTADDPRMAVIEIKPDYISYWLATLDSKEFEKEVSKASEEGKIAQTGVNRRLTKDDIQKMRKEVS